MLSIKQEGFCRELLSKQEPLYQPQYLMFQEKFMFLFLTKSTALKMCICEVLALFDVSNIHHV